MAEEALLEEGTLEEQQEGTEHARIWGKSVLQQVTQPSAQAPRLEQSAREAGVGTRVQRPEGA